MTEDTPNVVAMISPREREGLQDKFVAVFSKLEELDHRDGTKQHETLCAAHDAFVAAYKDARRNAIAVKAAKDNFCAAMAPLCDVSDVNGEKILTPEIIPRYVEHVVKQLRATEYDGR